MEEDDPAAAGLMIPEGCIRRVKLSVASNEEILNAVPVMNPSEKPFPITHGSQLQDNPSLGLPLQLGTCDCCGVTQVDQCQGHFGFIELPVPIYHPSHITELGKILNMICLRCLRLKNVKLKRKGTRKQSSKFTSCSYCQDLPPLCVAEVIKSNGARTLKLTAPLRAEVGDGFWSFLDQFGFQTRHRAHSRPLPPKEVQNIMQKISDETRKKLAAGGYNLQDGYVMNYMCVPPNCLHTTNVLDENTVMCPPDTSKNLLRKVLRTIGDIKSSSIANPNFEAREVGEDDLQVAVADYINLRGTIQGSQHATITRQPAPKQWQQKMKTLFISKSSSFSCRAVITGDPYIGLDVVGVPDEVARKISVEEHVTDYNIARLQGIMDKGLCLTYKDVNSNTYDLDVGKANDKKQEGPSKSIKLLNLLQPLLMESLLMDGFSVSLKDFNGPGKGLMKIRNSPAELNKFRELIVNFAAHSSALGLLIDPKRDSAMKKLVEQLGFLGHQLQYNGRLYSSNLVQDCYEFLNKSRSTRCYEPLEANGFVNSSFSSGLSPYEELLHSISTREKIMRTSKGLVESGNLFKNMMAILRDVVVCYDGTIRTSCSKSVLQFDSRVVSRYMTPGDSVGILAATAVANAAYKAVLDPNQNNMTSWDSMKEVLLTKSDSKTDINDQKVILYLNKYPGVINAAQSCLKRIKVEDCATEISIRYCQEITQAAHCLVGYINLDKKQLNQMEVTVESIIQTCQEAIVKQVKKKGKMRQIMKRSNIILSECLCDEDPCDEKYLQVSCFQFFLHANIATELPESHVVHLMTNSIFPVLLETTIKGDPRVQKSKIIWIEPSLPCWVQTSSAEQKGELALEITVEKEAAAENGDAWGVAVDACIPVMHLIDTTRSMPYSIQGVKQVFGISFAFDRAAKHLSKAIGMVTKSVLKEHLTTVASSMTCTGNLHGFNSSDYKATFQSLNVQAPFTEATLSRPMQCFQKSAEKGYIDQLDSVVSTSSWGNQAAIGTGSGFEILWDIESQSSSNETLGGYGLYDFLGAVGTIGATEGKTVVPHSSCLYDVDDLLEDEMSCLGGNSPISRTDKLKVDYRQRNFKGRRTGMCLAAREHQGMQTMSIWNSDVSWKNNESSRCEENTMGPQHSTLTRSTNTSVCNQRRFTGQVFERKQPKHILNSAVTRQDDRPSWFRENVSCTQNFPIAESPGAAGWNRKNSTFGRGGGRAMRKSEGSHRGGGNSRNWKAQKNSSARQGGSSSFTPVEQKIYAQVDPIIKNVKRIIRESRDGIKLSPEDEMFIVTNILMYHPEKEKKMAGQGNYIMVAKHKKFHSSRCLYVASSDGSCSDFSYKKCLENFVRIHYPGAADSFCRKYFK
ncbi:hypothetical protein EJB05_18942, partial [Eragrostis curvula]